MSIYSTRKSKNQKKWTEWRAKRGTLSKLSTFLSQLKGGPFGEKTNFRKKVSQCRKTERGPFGIFKHPICCKISKKLKGGPFGEKKYLEKKSHNAEKLKGAPLRFFNIHSVANHEKIEGNKKLYFREKTSQWRKQTERGGLFGIFKHPFCRKTSRKMQGEKGGGKRGEPLVCYAEKQEKPFWFSSLGQIVQFGAIIFCRTFKSYFGQFVRIEKKESL